ncbi:MAG: pirin family protein [Candidatus Andersenbacteria bacterium]|nr:pirin family protein [Candidatus Andersenbacteria bacterium]
MQTTLHKADTRGYAEHGWLSTFHSFSFANYFDQRRMGFGALRVLNDDTIAGGKGFGTHPHDNMEIITIPLEGELAHADSMGTKEVIHAGEVQVMSAGMGVEHSEFNNSADAPVKLLQIWILPNQENVAPRYDQQALQVEDRHNKLQQIISPDQNGKGLWIHQNAWLHLGNFDVGQSTPYALHATENGAYIFVISGSIQVGDQVLAARDGYGVWDVDAVSITALTQTEFLVIEVLMAI